MSNANSPKSADGAPGSGQEDRVALAVFLMIGTAAGFTLSDTNAKWLLGFGLPVGQIVFMRYLGHFLSVAAVSLPRQGLRVFKTKRPGLQVARAAAALLSTAFSVLSLRHLPITMTTAVHFSGPVVVTLLSIPILGERVGLRRFGAIVAGFLGVLIVVQPWGKAFHPAVFLALASLLSASLYYVLTRILTRDDSAMTCQMWSSGLAVLVTAPLAVHYWVTPPHLIAMLGLIVLGIVGAISHGCLTVAHRFAPASTLAPVIYVQVLFASISSYYVFGVAPNLNTGIGAVVIIAAGIYISHRERAERRQASVARAGDAAQSRHGMTPPMDD